jgi:hypothetical protein
MSDKVNVVIWGGSFEDRRRVRKVLELLKDPNEWDGEPPAIGEIASYDNYEAASCGVIDINFDRF